VKARLLLALWMWMLLTIVRRVDIRQFQFLQMMQDSGRAEDQALHS
jgi:hypothetical protein